MNCTANRTGLRCDSADPAFSARAVATSALSNEGTSLTLFFLSFSISHLCNCVMFVQRFKDANTMKVPSVSLTGFTIYTKMLISVLKQDHLKDIAVGTKPRRGRRKPSVTQQQKCFRAFAWEALGDEFGI